MTQSVTAVIVAYRLQSYRAALRDPRKTDRHLCGDRENCDEDTPHYSSSQRGIKGAGSDLKDPTRNFSQSTSPFLLALTSSVLKPHAKFSWLGTGARYWWA